MERVRHAVVGAPLQGMPMHGEPTLRNIIFIGPTMTALSYRLYAMADGPIPKPTLVHNAAGASIALEAYELDVAAFGSFVVGVPPPLAIGTVTLADGSQVKGFVAGPRALEGATDITHFGWRRAYLDQKD